MSDETTTPAPAPAVVQPESGAVDSREARLAAQIAKASKAIEASEPDDGATPANASPPAPAVPPKDAKGRFVKQGKAKATETTKEPAAPAEEPAKEEPEPEPAAAESPRALLKAGKIEEAFKAAFGDDVDPKQYAISSKNFAALRNEVKKHREKFAEREQRLEAKASELLQKFEPFAEAQRCYEAGDYAGMVKAITRGEVDASEFNRRLLHSQYSKDPQVEKLERELREYRQAEERRRADEATAAEQRRAEQARAEYVEQLKSELESHEDTRIAKAAKRGAFVRSVYKILEEHYDPHSGTTLPTHEAAEMALEQIYSAHSEWAEVFGAGQPQSPAIPVQGGSSPERQAVAAKPPPRSLRSSEAAEAAPRRTLSRDELFAKYETQLRVAAPG